MEPYTLDRNFHKKDILDDFKSIVWTERYYGDSEVELVVPATVEMLTKLPLGVFLGIDECDEIMILETRNIKDGNLKYTGISLLKWLNNRFIRNSNNHTSKTWEIQTQPGTVLWSIVYYNCVVGSPFLNDSGSTGIANSSRLAIPGLGLIDYDTYGDAVIFAIPYGPVYDAMREIAVGYEVGMQILLGEVTDTSYFLGFRSYRGLDRTSRQADNPIVRFSPTMDSLANAEELEAISQLKTLVYSFATHGPAGSTGPAGMAELTGLSYTGFDLRALLVLDETITAATLGGDTTQIGKLLNTIAHEQLVANSIIQAVDGEIVPTSEFVYGIDYYLGDLIEVEGSSGITSISRVTEYVRTHDESGEKSYPTVEAIS